MQSFFSFFQKQNVSAIRRERMCLELNPLPVLPITRNWWSLKHETHTYLNWPCRSLPVVSHGAVLPETETDLGIELRSQIWPEAQTMSYVWIEVVGGSVVSVDVDVQRSRHHRKSSRVEVWCRHPALVVHLTSVSGLSRLTFLPQTHKTITRNTNTPDVDWL